MNNDKSNITIGLPKENGAVFWAPAGTTLPSDASSSLGGSYVNLGYISSDGLTHSTAEESDKIVSWGKDVVMVAQTAYSETIQLNLLETVRASVLQFIRGTSNVSIDQDGAVSSGTTGEPLPRGVIVIDTYQNNGATTPRVHRIVFGDCQLTDRSGDVTYNNSDPLTYPVTIEAYKFASKALTGKQVYHDDFWTAPDSQAS